MENAKVPATEKDGSNLDFFLGKFECTLDSKGRLTIPRKFRRLVRENNSGEKQLVICPLKDRAFALYTLEYFAGIIAKLRALEPGPDKRRLIRFFSSESEQLRIDRFGRVQIPPDVIETLGEEKNLVVVGAVDYMEVWKSDDYKAVRTDASDGYYNGPHEF